MWSRLLFLMCLTCGACVAAQGQSRWQGCLPSDVTADEVIASEPSLKDGSRREITVADKLKELRARCRSRKLVDSRGRQIRFYRLIGCWGNPPADYQEIMDSQNRELAKLRRRYRVVEISCNPSGVMIQ